MEKALPSKPVENRKDPLRFQVGANAGQEVTLGINSMKAQDLGIVQTQKTKKINIIVKITLFKIKLKMKLSLYRFLFLKATAALDVTVQAKASLAIEAYDQALTKVSTQRAKLGAVQNSVAL